MLCFRPVISYLCWYWKKISGVDILEQPGWKSSIYRKLRTPCKMLPWRLVMQRCKTSWPRLWEQGQDGVLFHDISSCHFATEGKALQLYIDNFFEQLVVGAPWCQAEKVQKRVVGPMCDAQRAVDCRSGQTMSCVQLSINKNVVFLNIFPFFWNCVPECLHLTQGSKIEWCARLWATDGNGCVSMEVQLESKQCSNFVAERINLSRFLWSCHLCSRFSCGIAGNLCGSTAGKILAAVGSTLRQPWRLTQQVSHNDGCSASWRVACRCRGRKEVWQVRARHA